MPGRSDFVAALAVAGGYIVILCLGEFVRRKLPSKPEVARKSIHFLGGMVALSFPYVFRSHWIVMGLAAGFSAVMLVTKRRGMLRSIHGIDRRSLGAYYMPFAVYAVFLLGRDEPVLYFVSILVMTVSDTLAALLGGRYGSIRYDVEGQIKTLEGSVVFFFVTFLCVHLSLLLMTPTERLTCVLISLVIALLVTGFEAISYTGSDNLFIPFGTYFILARMLRNPIVVTVEDLGILVLMIAVTLTISLKSRLFRVSGLIGMVLLNFAAWSLCDFYWLVPLLLAQGGLYLMARFFVRRLPEWMRGYQIRVLVYSAIIPAVGIFLANAIDGKEILYPPYVASVAGQIAVILYFLVHVAEANGNSVLRAIKRSALLRCGACALSSTLAVAAMPVSLYLPEERGAAVLLVGAGVLASVCAFHVLLMRYDLTRREELRLKMRFLSVALGVAVVMTGTVVRGRM